MGGGIPRESDFEGYWDLIAGLRQNWEKQRLHSWRAHTKYCAHRDPGEGTVTPGDTEPDLPVCVGGSPAEAEVAVAHRGDKDTGSGSSGKYSLA